jgi:putative transposase
MPRPKKPASPFRYFNSSPEIIRLVMMMVLSKQLHQAV